MSACLTDQDLQRCRPGAMSGDNCAEVLSHLQSCEACGRRYRELIGRNEQLIDAARAQVSEICGSSQTRSVLAAHVRDDEVIPATRVEGPEIRQGRPASAPPGPADAPAIPDFDLARRLAKGAFGEVWLGRSRTGVFRAVKVLTSSGLSEVEFEGLRAFQKCTQSHSNLVSVLHVGRTDEHLYYVMELADSCLTAPTLSPEDYEPRTLKVELARRGQLPAGEAIDITRQLLGALDHLHRSGLLHRDVKPANVIFVDGKAKLADIGLLTRHDRQEGDAGTQDYAPPEWVIDRSGDLYSLGVTLHEMLTGRLVRELAGGSVESESEVLAVLFAVIKRACAAEPSLRFQSASEFSAALDKAEPRRPTGGWRRGISVVAVAALLLVVAIILGIRRAGSAAPSPPAEPAALRVLFKVDQDAPTHYELLPDRAPLRTGHLIRLEADLGRPMYAWAGVIVEGEGVLSLYPAIGSGSELITRLHCPEASDEWLPLTPPDGMLIFVLLGSDKPISDTRAIAQRLAGLGPLPDLQPGQILRLADGRVESSMGAVPDTRGINVQHPVRTTTNMLQRMPLELGDQFKVIAALAVKQVGETEAVIE